MKFLSRRNLILLICIVVVLMSTIVLGTTLYAKISTSNDRKALGIDAISSIPYHDVALVLGAGVLPNGEPTDYLRQRVSGAAELYKAGRVKHILVSGDNSSDHYDEPTVMRNYAINLGVPASAITIDYAGLSTYDSCYRAQAIFGLHDLTVVSQGYHISRAVMTCENLGIQTTGVAAKRGQYRDYSVPYVVREYGSTIKAILETTIKPAPQILGKPEPIKLSNR